MWETIHAPIGEGGEGRVGGEIILLDIIYYVYFFIANIEGILSPPSKGSLLIVGRCTVVNE